MTVLDALSDTHADRMAVMQSPDIMSPFLDMMMDRISAQNQTTQVLLPTEKDHSQSLQQSSLLRVQDYLGVLNKVK